MLVEAKQIYSSSACNKTPNAIDWGLNNTIAFSTCHCVHVYKYDKKSGAHHKQTLLAHKKMITAVHWIKKPQNAAEDELLITSADNTASIWKSVENIFQLQCILIGHSNVVRNGTAIYISNSNENDLMILTTSSDSTVRIWLRSKHNKVECVQIISLGCGFGLDAKLTMLGENDESVLILSQDDGLIHIYIQNEEKKFVPAIKLSGHEDWVQSIDIIRQDNVLKIASASQDCHIRIWEVYLDTNSSFPDSEELKVDTLKFRTTSGQVYSVSLESILSGHENWVYSVKWKESSLVDGQDPRYQLLSASMDKTVIIWDSDVNSDIWLEKVRFGDVGGNSLGFFGAVFSPCGEIMIAHGHQGAIHAWYLDEDGDAWRPGLSFGGHHAAVSDIAWDPDGELVVSCSMDQTTRLHAPYVANQQNSWFEIARPQIHGYDMICIAMLNRYQFVSAGDEKVLRVFSAPQNFADALQKLCGVDTSAYSKNDVAVGASVPSLGLSNKAVFAEDMNKVDLNEEKHAKDRFPDFYFTPTELNEPPTEETLLQNTLWPEIHKLYGHPYEVYSVACNHSGTLVASSCKASKLEHCGIIIWNTSSWRQVTYLKFHSLTVTQLEFSPDDQYLLSVSRDRMWALYKYCPDDDAIYIKVDNLDRKRGVHSRIIWSCSWSFDSLFFATSSRDRKVAVWGKNKEDKFVLRPPALEVEDSATAVSFAPCLIDNRYLLAIGLENGAIILTYWSEGWNILQKLEQSLAHHLNVNRLKFSPVVGEAGSQEKNSNILQLASCSDDHHMNIYNIYTTASVAG